MTRRVRKSPAANAGRQPPLIAHAELIAHKGHYTALCRRQLWKPDAKENLVADPA